jgi:hypothetical protein
MPDIALLQAKAEWDVLAQNDGPANVAVDELFRLGPTLHAVTHGRGVYRQTPVTTFS